ncbi:MAG TPA: cupin domain-containing protein [Terriglobia bacterium]|nr:cupin domain-containing protein [Terriglobia bacterium]
MKKLLMVLLAVASCSLAQERKVAPTWLHRYVPNLAEQHTDFSSSSCRFTPIFGEGDSEAKAPQSVSRFGEVTVDGKGACEPAEYPRQEELYFVLDGTGVIHYGEQTHAMRKDDFAYVPPGVRHSLSGSADQPLRLAVATVKIQPEIPIPAPPPEPMVANLDELKEQTVEGHPTSVLYRLLIGPHTATRDRINAAYEVADFFLMDFATGGTNFPHHHEVEEEIYLVLDGEGQMAAGGGTDGVMGLHPAKAGDAYYFRPNCTVGFYNQDVPGAKAHILALRTFVPLPKNPD